MLAKKSIILPIYTYRREDYSMLEIITIFLFIVYTSWVAFLITRVLRTWAKITFLVIGLAGLIWLTTLYYGITSIEEAQIYCVVFAVAGIILLACLLGILFSSDC